MKIATLAIIVSPGNKILFGRKQGSPEIGEGTLNGPGGKMEEVDGGSVVHCVIRETHEELGIVLVPSELEECAVITFYAGGKADFETHVFRTGVFFGVPRETASMVPEWHRLTRIPFNRMLESDSYWFPLLIQGLKFNANVYYRERAKGFQKIEIFPL